MGDHFWINPLGLDIVDGNYKDESNRHTGGEPRRTRSVDSELTDENISNFFHSIQVADKQLQELQNHMIDVQYSYIDPGSLESQEYEFLKVPDDAITNADSGFVEIFHYLQRYAAALYHLLNGTDESENSEYYQKLSDAKINMSRILSDVQLAMLASKQTPYDDITYDMLPPTITDGKSNFQASFRDFIIIRDYGRFLQLLSNKKDIFM